MSSFTITAPLERDTDGTWCYLHVPEHVRQELKAYEKRGIIAVRATIGRTTWDGSLLPWADGSAQLTVNQRVRTAENLSVGDRVQVSLQPRSTPLPD